MLSHSACTIFLERKQQSYCEYKKGDHIKSKATKLKGRCYSDIEEERIFLVQNSAGSKYNELCLDSCM